MSAQAITATEAEYQATIIGAGRMTGWMIAHFRAARTKYGWVTPVGGDGAGFPDLVMLHEGAGLLWYVELKRDDNRRLRPAQAEWRRALIACGAVHRVIYLPSELDSFLQEMADARKTRLEALIAADREARS